MSIVDCRGLACPQPVTTTKKALDQLKEGELLVIVDNAVSCNNVERFAQSQGFSVEVEQRGEDFSLRIRKGKVREEAELPQQREKAKKIIYPPSKGEVYFNQKKISGLKPHQICKMGIARTFQVVKPLQRMSVLDNVIASAFLRVKSRGQAEEIALETIKFTGLLDDRDVISKGLPLGKRKKLEIARALATQPEMILLDESFAGLNPTELDESIGIIRKIKERGITIMIIEHHMKVIMAISDRIVVLSYGQQLAEGTPNEIGNNRLVVEAYLGEAESP